MAYNDFETRYQRAYYYELDYQFLNRLGLLGHALLAAFLAGSFFPFSSEAVMAGLQAAGLEPLPLVIYMVASAMCLVPCSTTVWAEWVRWNG